MPSVVVDVAPAQQPITLDDARDHLRLDPSGSPAVHPDDDYIEARIPAAVEAIERMANVACITQDISIYFDKFPASSGFILPRSPLVSVLGIDYTDEDSSPLTQTVASTVYEVDAHSKPARIVLADGQEWPDLKNTINAVRLRLRVGYGDDPDDVPFALRQAMLLTLADMYEHRETLITGTQIAPIKAFPAIQRLVGPHMVFVPYDYGLFKEVVFNEHRIAFEGRIS